MKIHRFFVTQDLGDKDSIFVDDPDLFHQLRNVFRFTVGGQVILLDNSGYEYHALISAFERGGITFSIVSRKTSKKIPEREIFLFCALIKKNKFEWVLEKGTELGISKFVPIVSDRSEKKDINLERAKKILKEATEQSERAIIPTLDTPTSLETALKQEIPLIAFHPKGEPFLAEHVYNKSLLGVLIGPEGGWTEREIFLFKKNKIPIYSLGNGILKTETAAIATASLLLL